MNPLSLNIRNEYFQNKKSPTNNPSKLKKKLKRVKSVNAIREKQWDNRFIYSKIPDIYKNNSREKISLHNIRQKSHSGRGNLQNVLKDNVAENTLYLYNKSIINQKAASSNIFLNTKNINQTSSTIARESHHQKKNMNNISNTNFIDNTTNIDYNIPNFLLTGEKNNKKNENYSKDDISYINSLNIKNIIKLWDEMAVHNNYRKLFFVIFKELDEDDKEELYSREVQEMISIKSDIQSLKKNIEERLRIIKEIYDSNKKLNTETVNKDNKENEQVINEISSKIETLREQTVKVCQSMKKLKIELNGIKYLNKYDINIISDKFSFDKNYLIKMKSELNFLREGSAKYYFNISSDQTPFLLKASDKAKISTNTEPSIHLVPLKEEIKTDIMESSYYIYQELIAYQNEKVNKKSLRCISPLKRRKNESDGGWQQNGEKNEEKTEQEIFNLNHSRNDADNSNNFQTQNEFQRRKSTILLDPIKLKLNIDKFENNKKEIKINEIKKDMNKSERSLGSIIVKKDKCFNYKNYFNNQKNNEHFIIDTKKFGIRKHLDKLFGKNEKNGNFFPDGNKKFEEDKKE